MLIPRKIPDGKFQTEGIPHSTRRLDDPLFVEALPFMVPLDVNVALAVRVSPKKSPPFRLDLGSAAVNEQFDTRDETGVIRSQKQRHLGNFLRFSHASHWDGGHNPRNHVGGLPIR